MNSNFIFNTTVRYWEIVSGNHATFGFCFDSLNLNCTKLYKIHKMTLQGICHLYQNWTVSEGTPLNRPVTDTVPWVLILNKEQSGFSQTHIIFNDGNIGIRVFTM